MKCKKHPGAPFFATEKGPTCWECKQELPTIISSEDTANSRQVGGKHYKTEIQHWDFAFSNDLDYFQGQITKYVTRWRKKNGLEDLLKAQHFLQKYIELNSPK